MIFVEGTRVTEQKRQALRTKNPPDSPIAQQLERWPDLLPPRLGGVTALLESNPGRDVLFCAHHGFEGSTDFGGLLNGSWVGANIHIDFWRIPFADLPTSEQGRIDFVFSQWDQMQQRVRHMAQKPAR